MGRRDVRGQAVDLLLNGLVLDLMAGRDTAVDRYAYGTPRAGSGAGQTHEISTIRVRSSVSGERTGERPGAVHSELINMSVGSIAKCESPTFAGICPSET